MGKIIDFLFGHPVEQSFATKSATMATVPVHSPETIERQLRDEQEFGTSAIAISAVFACARVIAEGLALPPCYLHQTDARGKKLATRHPLYRLLHLAPNDRQTSYEFREQIGLHLALNGNAFVWVNRSRATNEILEMLPMDPGSVTVLVDPSVIGAPVRYFLYGREVPADQIWHLKGPAWRSYEGMSAVNTAHQAIGLARHAEKFASDLFINGGKLSGLISAKTPMTDDQVRQLREAWSRAYSGPGKQHKTAFLPADLAYTPMSATATDAQMIEARRYQIEEICRFFRVSPTKVFQSGGSQSYASVEQAHIAHDQDTDAHWHARFVQSASVHLLTAAERAAGYTISLDNRDFLRGTAVERMTYYNAGIAAGIITRNEAREMEGFDRSDDPTADTLTPAANLFGPDQAQPAAA